MLNVTKALLESRTQPQPWQDACCAHNKELRNALHGAAIAFVCWALVSPSLALAAPFGDQFKGTMTQMLLGVGQHIHPFIVLCQVLAAAIGAYFVFDGLVELWAVNDDRALKYLQGRDRFSNGSALVSILLGGIFIALSDLSLVGALSRTIAGSDTVPFTNTDGTTTNEVVGVRWEWAASHTAAAQGNDISAKTKAAAHALLGIMQVLGMVAMIRGWLTLNAYYNQRNNAGLGIAFGWIIGGVLAWNLNWFGKALNKTFGFDLLWFFKFT